MLDAWIANQGRHHENWVALWDGTEMRLAPTFDHGAALARNLLDSEREERLTTRDRNRTLAAFAEKGRSAFYNSPAEPRPLELREAFRVFARAIRLPLLEMRFSRRAIGCNRNRSRQVLGERRLLWRR